MGVEKSANSYTKDLYRKSNAVKAFKLARINSNFEIIKIIIANSPNDQNFFLGLLDKPK